MAAVGHSVEHDPGGHKEMKQPCLIYLHVISFG